MKCLRSRFIAVLLMAGMLTGMGLSREAEAQQGGHQAQPAMAEQLFAMANDTRAQQGLTRLQWDPQLAAAAMKHCQHMALGGPISHQYPGELDVAERASEAGAHFGLIEENIALGPYPATIHQGWLNSPPHRANLLNPDIDRIGVAVVAANGVLYAVADYAHGVPQRSGAQVEAAIAALIRPSGVNVLNDARQARAACAVDHGMPRGSAGLEPGFVMRWQDSDLHHLPEALQQKLASGQYHRAEVGSCDAHGSEGSFTAYRVAVLLY